MSKTEMILSGLCLLALLLFLAPGILAYNRGNILRNIALWLAIFLGLALFYKNFGPDSPKPLFKLPPSLSDLPQEKPEAKREDPAPENAPKDNESVKKKDQDI